MNEIIAAVQNHQYLVVFVLAWPILVALASSLRNTPLGPYIDLARLPQWARWVVGQGVAGVGTFVALVAQGVSPADAVLAGAFAMAGTEWSAQAIKLPARIARGMQ